MRALLHATIDQDGTLWVRNLDRLPDRFIYMIHRVDVDDDPHGDTVYLLLLVIVAVWPTTGILAGGMDRSGAVYVVLYYLTLVAGVVDVWIY